MNLSHLDASLNLIWDQTAVVAEIPTAATADSDRTTLIASLRCSRVLEMMADMKQRAGYGPAFSICEVSCEVPAVSFSEDDRFIVGTKDYRIRKITPVPATSPSMWYLVLEDES